MKLKYNYACNLPDRIIPCQEEKEIKNYFKGKRKPAFSDVMVWWKDGSWSFAPGGAIVDEDWNPVAVTLSWEYLLL